MGIDLVVKRGAMKACMLVGLMDFFSAANWVVMLAFLTAVEKEISTVDELVDEKVL